MIDLRETFEKFEDDYLKFDLIDEKHKLHSRPDICAFLTIDRLLPMPSVDIVSASEHDEFFLEANCDMLAEVATEDDILTLVRCGVMYSKEYDCLSMFS